MKILLTGTFGNLGLSTLEELLRQGHDVRCFVSKRRAHLRTARRFSGKIDLVQGDMRQPAARPESGNGSRAPSRPPRERRAPAATSGPSQSAPSQRP